MLLEPDDRPNNERGTGLDPDQLHVVFASVMPALTDPSKNGADDSVDTHNNERVFQEIELTQEQQFTLRSTELLIDRMSRDQLIDMIKALHVFTLQQKNVYKYFLAVKWGLKE